MTATRTTTASADGRRRPPAALRRPRIGILGIMQDLYDDMIPGIAERQGGYAAEIGAQPGGRRRTSSPRRR